MRGDENCQNYYICMLYHILLLDLPAFHALSDFLQRYLYLYTKLESALNSEDAVGVYIKL